MERRRISLEDEIIFTRSQARRPTGCVAGTSKVGAVTGGRGGGQIEKRREKNCRDNKKAALAHSRPN